MYTPREMTYLIEITVWAYYLNSIFTCICFFCDIFIYFRNEDKQKSDSQNDENWIEKLNDFNRNKYAIVVNPLSYYVTLGFWFSFFFMNNYFKVSEDIRNFFNVYYLHFWASIILLIDLWQSERKPHFFSWKMAGICVLILICYDAIIIFLRRYEIYAYKFFEKEHFSIPLFLFANLGSCSLILFGYYIEVLLLGLKFEKTQEKSLEGKKNEEDDEEIRLISEE